MVADNSFNPSPFTTAYSVVEYVIKKEHRHTVDVSKEALEKFKSWEQEDYHKDDLYVYMWDPDWIDKSEENYMSYDILKAALEKKKAQQTQNNTKNTVDTGKGPVKDQVSGKKPGKKSAGRGR